METSNIAIRTETPADHPAVYQVNKLAFEGREAEPRLVEAIRRSPEFIPELSLVAVSEDQIIGHILFSRVTLQTRDGDIPILALAPLAVLPDYQNQGIGSQLTRRGLEVCRKLDFGAVSVLGHPDYYPRFGFVPARPLGIEPSFDVPAAAWMIIELQPGALNDLQGRVRYPTAFQETK